MIADIVAPIRNRYQDFEGFERSANLEYPRNGQEARGGGDTDDDIDRYRVFAV